MDQGDWHGPIYHYDLQNFRKNLNVAHHSTLDDIIRIKVKIMSLPVLFRLVEVIFWVTFHHLLIVLLQYTLPYYAIAVRIERKSKFFWHVIELEKLEEGEAMNDNK